MDLEQLIRECEEMTTLRLLIDETNVNWSPSSSQLWSWAHNVATLLDDMLATTEVLVLNDVYEVLGLPRTAPGAIVGWYQDETHSGRVVLDFELRNLKLYITLRPDGIILDKF